MKISMLGMEKEYAGPMTVLDIVRDMAPEYERAALGCFCGGQALELNQRIEKDCAIDAQRRQIC